MNIDDLSLTSALKAEFIRWIAAIGEPDLYSGKHTLGIYDVLKAHFLIADFFLAEGEGLGGLGPRDLNLLHSAMQRQHIEFGGKKKWTDRFDICATLMFGLIMNHPFHDANKRTAFLSALLYLHREGRTPTVSHKEFEDFTVEIANHGLKKYKRYRDLAEDNTDAEVTYISHFLRKNTREIDKRIYTVTYRELAAILRKFGYDFDEPDKNFINVIKITERKTFLGKSVKDRRYICQVGFPGWTKQVNLGAIKTIRQKTYLTHEWGCDSASFFRDIDEQQILIAHYQEPLRRLARR